MLKHAAFFKVVILMQPYIHILRKRVLRGAGWSKALGQITFKAKRSAIGFGCSTFWPVLAEVVGNIIKLPSDALSLGEQALT